MLQVSSLRNTAGFVSVGEKAFLRNRSRWILRAGIAAAAIVVSLASATDTALAQTLRPKRTLTVAVAPGCENVSARPTTTQRDVAAARRQSAAGQEAALIGDQKAARDAFAKAADLNPVDDRIAYDLGRAHEELADTTPAIREYCRYLTLSPAGSESGDVRGRLQQLVPASAAQSAQELLARFRLGLFLYDSARYDAAERAFDEVVQKAPLASEGYFNRGLMRAAIGSRAEALRDFEAYLAAVPTADDRAEVTRTIATLRRPVYGAGSAFIRGVIPGFGQIYTGRPVRGVLVFAGAAAATGFAVVQTTTSKQIDYRDPNGVPAPYTQQYRERKYLVPGIATAAGLTVIGALEAVFYARRSSRGASVVQTGRISSVSAAIREYGVSVSPYVAPNSPSGIRISARF
jgi:tetratricopeptide (TPR) repeat protein